MAIVPDLSGAPIYANGFVGRNTDRKLSDPNRTITGSPLGVTTPGYTGERVLDSVGQQLWAATDLTVNGWVPIVMVQG